MSFPFGFIPFRVFGKFTKSGEISYLYALRTLILHITMDKIFNELNVAITVCDEKGEILEMNEASEKVNLKPGMPGLIGKNVLDCHPEPAKSKLAGMLKEPQTNAYTIEKNGVKKLIYQTPWYENGVFKGLVEFSIVIPFEMPHYIRQPKA